MHFSFLFLLKHRLDMYVCQHLNINLMVHDYVCISVLTFVDVVLHCTNFDTVFGALGFEMGSR